MCASPLAGRPLSAYTLCHLKEDALGPDKRDALTGPSCFNLDVNAIGL
jgi:hypothetical protein